MEEFEWVEEFNDAYFPNWRKSGMVPLTNALAGEFGELCEEYLISLGAKVGRLCNTAKHLIGGGTKHRTVDGSEILEESADVFIYLCLVVAVRGHSAADFSEAIRQKIVKNIERMKQLETPVRSRPPRRGGVNSNG